jgi:hypothetical protein
MLALSAASCAPTGLSQVPAGTGQIETASASNALLAPVESHTTVSSEPVETYTRLARGINGCWFGPGGPLRATHVLHAEVRSPADGGKAEIAIHERDLGAKDQRGLQAFRVSIEGIVTGSRVKVASIKLPPGFGEAMTRDVDLWAKGEAGCQLRASFPQPEEKPAPKAKAGGKSTNTKSKP